jgi:hypothetical protein
MRLYQKGDSMRTILSLLAIVAIALALSTPSAKAEQQLTICYGKFALCAASTCTPTGKTIKVNNGTEYPEVECRCPILNGGALADLTAGNMQGSCDQTDENHVWSLFAPRLHYPQEASGFSKKPKDMRARIQKCDKSLQQGYNASNCFSFNCEIGKDGIAICKCPMGQVPAETTFLTEAGQGDPEACNQHPVSLPLINPEHQPTK